MTSVTRKTHMPSVDDSNCCSLSSKWCCSSGSCAASAVSLSAKIHLLLFAGVIVRGFCHHWLTFKVVGRRRRGRLLPLQPLRVPRILRRARPFAPGPRQVDHRQQVPYRENGRAGRRHDVQHLKLGCVVGIAARHSLVSKNELWKEGEIESHE